MAILEELLYETAAHALERQERQFAELRARTGTLLAIAALCASFLGATAVDRVGLSFLALMAIAALTATLGLCLYVLISERLTFALDISTIHATLHAGADDDRVIHVSLAYELDRMRADNEPWIDDLAARFRAAGTFLAIEMSLWIAALTVG